MALGGRIEIDVVPNLDNFDSELRNGLQGTESAASSVGTAIGVALAAGTALAAVGFKQAIALGIEFQATLNTLQSVTQATTAQMTAVSAAATRLGSDLTLPATSAADAAEVMLELAKGGLTVEQSMEAARGTIMLAAAAQISGAEAAQIQSAALNSFGLEAGQAGLVADVLANSANAASGEITEFADAMQQVGAVANQFGISIEDTSTALSLFANAGIRGSDAGTLLKSALLAMANPSNPAAKAMRVLGLEAFDATGKFVGLESVFGQLREASGRLTTEQYTQAAATVFGSDAVRLAGVAAGVTAEEWDAMSAAVSRAGGAQEVAAAKMKGLGGAIEGLNSQLETAQLQVFDAIAKPLEQAVRAGTELVPKIGAGIAAGLRVIVAAGETVGPALARGIAAGAGEVADAGRAILGPFVDALGTGIGIAIETGTAIFEDYITVLRNVVSALTPVAEGIGAVADAATQGDGALFAIGATLSTIGSVAATLSGVLVPIGTVIGGLVSGFAALPGPIQSVVIAMLALRFAGPLLSSLATGFNNVRTSGTLFGSTLNAVTAPARLLAAGVTASAASLRQFGGEMAAQRGIAASAGQSIGRLASAQAAFQTSTLGGVVAARNFTQQVSALRAGAAAAGQPIGAFAASMSAIGQRVPLITQMGAAFATASGSVSRFGAAAGTAAAAATGLRGIGTGLIGALGGPFGAAITAAVIGLGLLGAANRAAAADEAAHEATVDSLADALKASGGEFNQAAKETLAATDEFKRAADSTKQFGVSLDELRDAAVQGGAPLDAIRTKLRAIVEENTTTGGGRSGRPVTIINQTGRDALEALGFVEGLAGGVVEARDAYDQFAEAVDKAGGSLVNGASSGSALRDALLTLGDAAASADDKTRALNDALNALSGGQLSLEQANARLNESIDGIGTAFKEAGAGAKEAGTGLLDATGSINTTTEAGRKLLDETADLGRSMQEAALGAFEAAGGFGNLGPATQAATEAAQRGYDAFIQSAQAMGLTAEQAQVLATRAGLIPTDIVMLITAQGLDQTGQELLQLKVALDSVPGQKSVTVQALSEEATAKLRELGFEVTTLPNGQVLVEVKDEAGRARLNAFLAFANGQISTVTVDANPDPATGKIGATVQLGNGQTARMTLDANPDPATGKIGATVDLGNGQTARMTFDANPDPATGKIHAVVDLGNGSSARITLNPNDLVSAVIARLKQDTSSTHTVYIRQSGNIMYTPGGRTASAGAMGGIVKPMHDGGVLGFARGGIGSHVKLKPMRGGIAQVVPPNTWRVIGDRVRDDEAFIPINRSHRSQQIFEETARRMGYAVARKFADGGFADRQRSALSAIRIARQVTGRAGDMAAVVAAVNTLRSELARVQQSVSLHYEINNPLPERGSDSVARVGRRQSAMGLFGAPTR